MNSNLLQFSQQGELVVLVGAGVSKIGPTALPDWKATNKAISRELRLRLESALGRENYLEKSIAEVDDSRANNSFPPDYQAQILHEMCGEHYFEGLQSFDVDASNAAHDGIAALAQAGKLKAIVTTNFDRLLEKSLERRGVSFDVACEDEGFLRIAAQLRSGTPGPIPVVKIHGCVSRADSMIDTLKQRRLGRSRALTDCLEPLFPNYWLYVGFSADDLEDNPDYLGLRNGAAQSVGATFLFYSYEAGSTVPKIGAGAKQLMKAYGERGHTEKGSADEFIGTLCQGLALEPPDLAHSDEEKLGETQFQEKLKVWANGLSVSETGLCLAALLEANGQANEAAYLLDRLVRKELREERDTDDFRALQLHYGRLGAAWGRFVNVPDLNGAPSNASVESLQSLLRLQDTEWDFAANGYLASTFLWLNQGQEATQRALKVLRGVDSNQWADLAPNSDEEVVDAWICAAQVCLVNTGEATIQCVAATFEKALDRARRCGDVVRTARVIAFYLLALSETSKNVPRLAHLYDTEFAAAARVGDGFAQGVRLLALGRWLVGVGGQDLAKRTDQALVARQALEDFNQAENLFERQAFDPWITFARIQKAKAQFDLDPGDWQQAVAILQFTESDINRFPIFQSHLLETLAQIQKNCGDERARETLQSAIQAAHESGLFARRESLLHIQSRYDE